VCDTTIVVQSPHLGDSVQSLKAGILEIADIFVVTKRDLPGAQQLVRDLNAMLHLLSEKSDAWPIPVVPVSAPDSRGFDTLATRIGEHREWLARNSASDRRGERIRWEVSKRAITRVLAAARSDQIWQAEASRAERAQALLESALASIREG
jgi:LAO/AO transport system kinase